MLGSLAVWLIIMAVVVFLNRGEKPRTRREAEALSRQSAYSRRTMPTAPKRLR